MEWDIEKVKRENLQQYDSFGRPIPRGLKIIPTINNNDEAIYDVRNPHGNIGYTEIVQAQNRERDANLLFFTMHGDLVPMNWVEWQWDLVYERYHNNETAVVGSKNPMVQASFQPLWDARCELNERFKLSTSNPEFNSIYGKLSKTLDPNKTYNESR
jgi:hypothetical protein